MYEIIMHTLEHTLEESLGLLPFLLITYIIMEYIEHKMSAHTSRMVGRSGKFGPLIGALAGVFPQCGTFDTLYEGDHCDHCRSSVRFCYFCYSKRA